MQPLDLIAILAGLVRGLFYIWPVGYLPEMEPCGYDDPARRKEALDS